METSSCFALVAHVLKLTMMFLVTTIVSYSIPPGFVFQKFLIILLIRKNIVVAMIDQRKLLYV